MPKLSEEYLAKLKTLESGYYRLTEDVKNPHIDRRKKWAYFATKEVIPAGTEFQMIVSVKEFGGINVNCGVHLYLLSDRWPTGVSGEKAMFLLDKLEKIEMSLKTILDSHPVSASELIEQLMKVGKISIGDVKKAAEALDDENS